MKKRVVITGLGVAAPNGVGLDNFEKSIRLGKSGIRFQPELKELNFSCQVAGKPEILQEKIKDYFSPLQMRGLNSSGIIYGVISGIDAWKDAGLPMEKEAPNWDNGIIFGTGTLGVEKFREAVNLIDQGQTRRLGSTSVLQTMSSGISAYLNNIIGCGNQVTGNSSACCTGTEAVLMAFDRIRSGRAKRILAGSTSDSGPYIWGGFDAMRILPHRYNDHPEDASRPMSTTASGFVPGSGAGALVLEDLESALERGAKIYAEVMGGEINSGGQRGMGSMTAPNSSAVQRCISRGLENSGVLPGEIDVINGHLTATAMDAVEIDNWTKALGRNVGDFPMINSLKGMTGHCLSAAGSIECVASALQLKRGFIFGNVNCQDLHPDIQRLIPQEKIPRESVDFPVNRLVKASFGFGDVNAVAVFGRYEN